MNLAGNYSHLLAVHPSAVAFRPMDSRRLASDTTRIACQSREGGNPWVMPQQTGGEGEQWLPQNSVMSHFPCLIANEMRRRVSTSQP